MKIIPRHDLVRISVILALLCCVATQQSCLAATMPPVQITFIDADSSEPIAHANVIFYAQSKEGTLTGDGGSHANLFLVEGVTNDAGVISFSAQTFWALPFLFGSNNSMPSMEMYKTGYRLTSLSGYDHYPATTNEIVAWAKAYPQPVKVYRAITTLDLFEAVEGAGSVAESLYSHTTDQCAWEKIPKFLVAIENGVIEWESRPKEDGWYSKSKTYSREPRNPIKELIRSEQSNRQFSNCAKPSEFFRTYRQRNYQESPPDNPPKMVPNQSRHAPQPQMYGPPAGFVQPESK